MEQNDMEAVCSEYSLWIVPPEPFYAALLTIISRLSEQYSSAVFEPHITLLGDILETYDNMLAKTHELASILNPFRVNLNSLDHGDEYFECLFINVARTKEIMNANLQAKKVFSVQNKRAFKPHLSILYGHYDYGLKERIISDIGREFHIEFEVKSIHLVSSSSNMTPAKWRRLREFPLHNGTLLD